MGLILILPAPLGTSLLKPLREGIRGQIYLRSNGYVPLQQRVFVDCQKKTLIFLNAAKTVATNYD